MLSTNAGQSSIVQRRIHLRTLSNKLWRLLWPRAHLKLEWGKGLTCLKFRLFTNWKHLVHHEMQNTTNKIHDCWAAWILCQTRVPQQHSSTKRPAAGLLSSQTLQTVVKRGGNVPQWETATCPTFFRWVLAIKRKMSWYFSWNSKMSHFLYILL